MSGEISETRGDGSGPQNPTHDFGRTEVPQSQEHSIDSEFRDSIKNLLQRMNDKEITTDKYRSEARTLRNETVNRVKSDNTHPNSNKDKKDIEQYFEDMRYNVQNEDRTINSHYYNNATFLRNNSSRDRANTSIQDDWTGFFSSPSSKRRRK